MNSASEIWVNRLVGETVNSVAAVSSYESPAVQSRPFIVKNVRGRKKIKRVIGETGAQSYYTRDDLSIGGAAKSTDSGWTSVTKQDMSEPLDTFKKGDLGRKKYRMRSSTKEEG